MSRFKPHMPHEPSDYTPWPWGRLGLLAIGMVLLLAFVSVAFVLPAETGRDPTGIGTALRLDELGAPAPHDDHGAPEEPPEIIILEPFPYTWATENRLALDETGDLAEGESAAIDLAISDGNVHQIQAILTWTDASGIGGSQPDTFRLDVDGPAGSASETASNQDENGRLPVTVVAAQVPANGTVDAEDRAAAMTAVQERHPTDTAAVGNWTFTVTLQDVADSLGDEGNGWRLQVFVETYSPVLGDPPQDAIREATITLNLPAFGDWQETKVYLEEGSTLTYSWSATAEVQYDFHGARSDGSETSHAAGRAAEDDGELLVPFNGRHGWAFRNTGATDIELVLTIQGPFVGEP